MLRYEKHEKVLIQLLEELQKHIEDLVAYRQIIDVLKVIQVLQSESATCK